MKVTRLAMVRCSTSELHGTIAAYEMAGPRRRFLHLNVTDVESNVRFFPLTVTEARQLRNAINNFLVERPRESKASAKAASPKKAPVVKSHRQIDVRDRAPGGSRSGTKRVFK